MIGKARTYCHPKYYAGLPNSLYHNNGDGTFTDVSAASGIAETLGKGMGLSFLDFDLDGRLDVFVTNDTVPNFLFRNEGDGKFREMALTAGVALNDDGRAVSSMGTDARDIDNDGIEDAFSYGQRWGHVSVVPKPGQIPLYGRNLRERNRQPDARLRPVGARGFSISIMMA